MRRISLAEEAAWLCAAGMRFSPGAGDDEEC
jgi:hypothetical protein